MPWYDFGRQLILSGDLDPVYGVLHRALESGYMDRARMKRWLVAYWLFYHCGVATRLSEEEGGAFWDLCQVANLEKWPRGTERRHMRGNLATKTIANLARWTATATPPPGARRDWRERPELVVDSFAKRQAGRRLGFQEVAQRVEAHVGFGPWIAFKVADMLERVLGVPVDFSDCELTFYREPKAAAPLFDPVADLPGVVRMICRAYRDLQAPPDFKRGINIQEAETVMCKYKSHVNGHYPIGKDTIEVCHALRGWGPYAEGLWSLYTAEEVPT
jgi:hypothetical protein